MKSVTELYYYQSTLLSTAETVVTSTENNLPADN